ncbi:MAG: MOP flippase family protein [Candidatus Aminicenantes bacterium]|nr:MOP flippase family protein [Candidatus Aminicenantes bacterium]
MGNQNKINAQKSLENSRVGSLRQRTLHGIGWSGLSQVLRQGLQVGVSVVLARLLTPSDFGALAMVLVFTGFAASFSDLGLGAALIQKQDAGPRHAATVFCLQMIVGITLALLLMVTAPLIAGFYKNPRLVRLCLGIAPTFILTAFLGVPMALLQKAMAFRKIAMIETVAVFGSGTVAILLALNGWGIWSLVVQSLLTALLIAVLSWRLSRWRPQFAFNLSAWRELRRFSSALTGFNLLNYWIRNLDNLVIGKFIGPVALGIYSRAYHLMLYPISQVSGMVSRVMFSAMASIQDQTERLRAIYLRAARLIALVTFPLMTGMAVLADLFIVTVFGSPWQDAAGILRILAMVGLLQSVGTTLGWIYTARGRTDIMLRFGAVAGIVYAAAFLIGLRWGAKGVAAAYAASGFLLLWYPSWRIAGRIIGLTFSRMVSNLAGIFACSAGMGLAVLALQQFVFTLPGWASLLALVGAGITVYLLLIHSFNLLAYRDLRQLLHEQWQARRRSERNVTP